MSKQAEVRVKQMDPFELEIISLPKGKVDSVRIWLPIDPAIYPKPYDVRFSSPVKAKDLPKKMCEPHMVEALRPLVKQVEQIMLSNITLEHF